MKFFRKLINSVLLSLLLTPFPTSADQLLYFDNPSVVATLRPGGKVAGYYVGHSNEPFLFKPGTLAVCEFLIYGEWQKNSDYIGYAVKAWEPGLVPAPQSKVARGAIYVGYEDDDNDKWVIQFEEAPNGCRSRPDAAKFFKDDYAPGQLSNIRYLHEQGLRVRVVRRARAIGIRVVHVDRASVFATAAPTAKSQPSFSIGVGGLVASIQQNGGYSNIEHIVPTTGEKLTGWIRTVHLKDPFKN